MHLLEYMQRLHKEGLDKYVVVAFTGDTAWAADPLTPGNLWLKEGRIRILGRWMEFPTCTEIISVDSYDRSKPDWKARGLVKNQSDFILIMAKRIMIDGR